MGTRDILALYEAIDNATTLTKRLAQITITDHPFASRVASERSIIIPIMPIHWRYSTLSDWASLV